MRVLQSFALTLVFSTFSSFAHAAESGGGSGFVELATAMANSPQACRDKCNADNRNRKDDLNVGGKDVYSKCYLSCSTTFTGVTLGSMTTAKKKEWDPNNPVVQKCFSESGASDKFNAVTNHVTNNCIMNGLQAERRQARQEIPLPTPRPNFEGETAAAPATPTNTCDETAIERLETQCQSEKSAAVAACDESKLTNQSVQQTNGANAACGQARSYNAGAADELAAFRQQCSAKKDSCLSSCAQLESAVAQMPAGCSESLKRSYQSSSSAMKNLCEGLDVRMSHLDAQQMQYAQSEADAQACEQSTGESAKASNAANGEMPTTKNTTPLRDNFNTAGSLPDQQYSVTGSLPKGDSATIRDSDTDQTSKSDPSNDQRLDIRAGSSGSGSGGYGMGGGDLTALPTRTADAANAEASMKAAAAGGSEGAMSGRSGRRYVGPRGLAGENLTPEEAKKLAEKNKDLMPDLRAFLPNMGGMKAAAAFDGHGPHAHIFQKVHERYKALETTLFQPQDTPVASP